MGKGRITAEKAEASGTIAARIVRVSSADGARIFSSKPENTRILRGDGGHRLSDWAPSGLSAGALFTGVLLAG